MKTKYDPKALMGRTALTIQSKVEMFYSAGGENNFGDYQIEINMIEQNEKPFKIIKDPSREDDSLLVLQGGWVLSENALEEAQDRLGEITVYYMGKLYQVFKSYNDFLEWTGAEK